MYLDFYSFREKPFNLTPDPRFVFLSKNHKEAFAHLLYGINNRAGFISLTGEVGSGKTTVLRSLLGQLDADRYRTALIFNPCISAPELLRNINRELGIPANGTDRSSLLEALNLFLLNQNAEGRTVVLIIDEAQDLEASVLEQIRLISNLETDREKLVQIVLSGQPEFIQILDKKEMRQLGQRITVRYHLPPMDFQDTVGYIHHRLVAAGGKGGDIFSKKALKQIYGYSGGLPRLINAACDRALLCGYAKDTHTIDSRMAAIAIEDVRRNTVPWWRKKRFWFIPASAILLAFLAGGIYVNRQDLVSLLNVSQPIERKEEPPKKAPPVAVGKESFRSVTAELGKISESESAMKAFNVLAILWNVSPLPEGVNLRQSSAMENAARERTLRLYRFSGNLGALLRMNYPVVLELTLPGIPGKRFASLVDTENNRLLVDPAIGGRNSLLSGEIENYWSGQAILLWKDYLNLSTSASRGSREEQIKRLQGLLKEAGVFNGPLTGAYDASTRSAIREFQSTVGIEQDGIAGDQTLMLLYRSLDRFDAPRLMGGRK
jgi:general secretion pathway protein A